MVQEIADHTNRKIKLIDLTQNCKCKILIVKRKIE